MGHRGAWAASAAVLLLTVLVAAGWVPPADARPVMGPSPDPPSTVATSAVLSALAEPFAARAGYEDWYSSAVTGARPATGSELVVVTFKPANAGLFASPTFGSPRLTVAQIASTYGLPTDQYDSIEQYFVSQGLTVVHTWPDRLSLSLEGSAVTVGQAFGTSEISGSYEGHPALYPATAPILPPSIEPYVASVLGLSTGFDSFSIPVTPAVEPAASPSQSGDPITPAILRQWYDVSPLYNLTGPSTYATDQGIVLLLWGDGYAPSDIRGFFSNYYPSGFPQPNVVPYPIDGAPAPSAAAVNDPDQSAPQELTLDIEWAGSFAPGATLDAVYAPEGPAPGYSPSAGSMADALHTAVTLAGVTTISMSFGTPEAGDASLAAAWATYLAEAGREDITLLAATGDLGGDAESGCSGGPSANYPASSPAVLAIGGTVVSLQQGVLGGISGISESAWIGSGGGYSSQFSTPAWQAALNLPSRGVPDVSATASNNFLFYTGQSKVADGTSFATPLWAGLVAEMNALHGAPFGFITPRLYAVGSNESSGRIGNGLNDITSGGNCVANAAPGWDAATGWGSPRGVDLYEALTATFVNLSISVDPSAVAPAGSITISAHLANATTGNSIADVPVSIELVADEDFGPCAGTFGSSSPATDASGNVAVTITIPVCYLGSHAVASVTVVSDGYYGVNSTTVPVNLLALVPALEGIASYPYSVIGFVVIMSIASALGGVLGLRGPTREEQGVPPGAYSPPPAAPGAASPGPPPPPPPGPGPVTEPAAPPAPKSSDESV